MTIDRAELGTTDFSDIDSGETISAVKPGDVLLHDYLEPLGLTDVSLARDINVPANRITAILKGERAISADTAILLARRFGTSAEFWMNLQTAHDLEEAGYKVNSARKAFGETGAALVKSNSRARRSLYNQLEAYEAGRITTRVNGQLVPLGVTIANTYRHLAMVEDSDQVLKTRARNKSGRRT